MSANRPGRRGGSRLGTRATALLLALLLALAGAAARADDEPEASGEEAGEDADEEIGLFGRMGRSIDDTQRRASEGFTGFVSSVDGFFGDGTRADISNESWARLRVDVERPGGEDLGFDATVKVRVVLPQAEQRFRVLLDSEEEDDASVVGEDGSIRPARLDRDDGQDVSLALRFVRTARETSSLKFDLGLRQREGLLQFFGRLTAVAEGEMVRRWTGRVSNSYFYYARSGFENRLRFDVTRPIARTANLYFRSASAVNWRKGRKGAVIGQTLGLYADLGDSTALALEAIAGYTTAIIDQRPRYSGTEIRLRFRQNALRPWFFYEIWPSVAWPSSTDYERAWGGLVRVEVVFGQPRK